MPSKITRNYLPELFALGFTRSRPSMVTVNLTSRCNQQCVYCEIGTSIPFRENDILSPDDIKWILDQMAIIKIRKISLCGGEPFLFKGIFDIIDYAWTKKIRCSVTTNGMTAYLLSEADLNLLKESKAEINISVDSFRESNNSFLRGSEIALSNALKSIQLFQKYRIPVTVLTVISKYNFKDLYQNFSTAYERGIKQVLFQPVIYYSNYPDRPAIENKSTLNVNIDELDILMVELSKILKFERNHKIKSNVYRILPWIRSYLLTAANQSGGWFFNSVLKKFYCREVYAIIDISYDGGIQPCGLSPASISIIKNRERGLLALWSEATKGLKNDMRNRRYYDYCNGCCHHFSRNMMASIIKHPVKNRAALLNILPLLFLRVWSGIMKKSIKRS